MAGNAVSSHHKIFVGELLTYVNVSFNHIMKMAVVLGESIVSCSLSAASISRGFAFLCAAIPTLKKSLLVEGIRKIDLDQ